MKVKFVYMFIHVNHRYQWTELWATLIWKCDLHWIPRVPFGKVEVITSKILWSPPWLGWPLWDICVTNEHGYVPLVVNTSRSFPHSRLITGFVTRLTRQVPLVDQELLTLSEHLSSPSDFSGVRVTRSLVLYVCFIVVCPLVHFLLAIVLSVLRYADSDCPFGIFKLLFMLSITVFAPYYIWLSVDAKKYNIVCQLILYMLIDN